MEQFIDILAIKEHYQLFDIQAMQSAITPLLEKNILTKLYIHYHIIAIYIQHNFHNIPYVGYYTMTLHGQFIGSFEFIWANLITRLPQVTSRI